MNQTESGSKWLISTIDDIRSGHDWSRYLHLSFPQSPFPPLPPPLPSPLPPPPPHSRRRLHRSPVLWSRRVIAALAAEVAAEVAFVIARPIQRTHRLISGTIPDRIALSVPCLWLMVPVRCHVVDWQSPLPSLVSAAHGCHWMGFNCYNIHVLYTHAIHSRWANTLDL